MGEENGNSGSDKTERGAGRAYGYPESDGGDDDIQDWCGSITSHLYLLFPQGLIPMGTNGIACLLFFATYPTNSRSISDSLDQSPGSFTGGACITSTYFRHATSLLHQHTDPYCYLTN